MHAAVIGEFTHEPSFIRYISVPDKFEGLDLPARPYRNLRTLPKRLLPGEVLAPLSHPAAFVQVGNTAKKELYDLAYKSFVADDEYVSQFWVTSDSYSLDNDLHLAAFMKFVAANVKLVTLDGQEHTMSLYEAAFQDLGEYVPELRSNVNSPGYLSLRSSYITPLVASAFLALALSANADDIKEAAENDRIIFGNTEAPADDPCTASVHRSTVQLLRMFDLDKWADACEAARKVEANTGLRSGTTVDSVGDDE